MGQLIAAFIVTLGLVLGAIYFWNELWPLLPPWLSVILFILLAVVIIGYPIYSLARWSDRRLDKYMKTEKGKQAMQRDNNEAYDKDDDW